MSKKIKRIISNLLLIAAVATIEPSNYINLVTDKAYASSSFSSSDNALLSSLDTNKGSFSFSGTRSSATGKVTSSVDEVEITAKAKNSSYKITINGTEVIGEGSKTVGLDKGRNTFKIKVEDPSGEMSAVTYYAYITRGTSSYSEDDDHDKVYLDNISVSGESFSFSNTKNSYTIEVAESIDEIRIKAEPEDDYDTVEIDGTTVNEDDNYRKWVSLDKGKNIIEITVEDEDGNDRTYTLNVYRGEKAPTTTTETGQIDNNQDSIYLDDLNLYDAGTNINFNPRVTAYYVNVKEDCENIIINAEPDDEDIVRVNDDKVEDSNYNKRVYLQKGKNVITIKVNNDYDNNDDDYEQRIYTIIVNRGTTTDGTNANSGANPNASVKANQWVKNAYGQWKYNDSFGKAVVDTWIFDKDYGKWYRLGYDGNMRTGWQYENGNTYYLSEDGSMQIGWKYISNYWRYFNSDGKLKTGWFQNNDGKWYYFYPGGAMASNVKINEYTLGSDGAMV